MNKKLLSLILALFLSVSFATISSAAMNVSHSADTVKHHKKKEVIVYVTNTGAKYHRAGCRYLSRSSNKITLSEAKAEGYSPCSVCDPPH